MSKEKESLKQIEELKHKIKEKSFVHQSLLEYLIISPNENNQKSPKDEKIEKIYQILKEKNILTNKCEFREFLALFSYLCEIHQIKNVFKIENLLNTLKRDLKVIFSENEIFDIFHYCINYIILLILVEQNIISIETIVRNINLMKTNDWNIVKYLYPEIRINDGKFLYDLLEKDEGYTLKKFIEENDKNLDFFYELRKNGEKEPKILELIREDKIDEFISYVEHSSINLNEKIQKEGTIFGKNNKKLTPIENSAYFGSLAIFKYLYMKEVKINITVGDDDYNIIEYAVQGRNYQIIHLLEERKEIIEELSYQKYKQKYLRAPIKLHYNEIFDYFMNKYYSQVTEEIIKLIIICHNYQLLDQLIDHNQIEFKDKAIMTKIFYGFCNNANEEIVKILINQPNLDINSKDKIIHHSIQMIRIWKKTTKTPNIYLWLLKKIETKQKY